MFTPAPVPSCYDFPEDWAGENGQYQHDCTACGIRFIGNKHRLYCKMCFRPQPTPAQGSVSDTPEKANVDEISRILADLVEAQIATGLGGTLNDRDIVLNSIKTALLTYGEKLRGELELETTVYQTTKDWTHRVQNQMTTILERCDDSADGAPDASPLGKFANELIGLSNEIMLGEVRGVVQRVKDLQSTNESLRKEIDQLKK